MKNKFSFLWWTGCSFSWWYVIWVGGLFWQTLSKETNVFNGMRPMDVGDHLRGVTSDQVVGENLSAYCHPSVDKHGVKSSVPRSRQHLAQNKSITMRCLLWQSSFFFLRFTSFCIIQRVCAIPSVTSQDYIWVWALPFPCHFLFQIKEVNMENVSKPICVSKRP